MRSRKFEKVHARISHLRRAKFVIECVCRRLHAAAIMHWVALHSRAVGVTGKPALIIAPHQDDETFGCGGLIALKRSAGVPVQVVFLTDGGQSHVDHVHLRCDDLVDQRRGEALRAVRALGLDETDVHFLSYPDGRLRDLPPAERGALIADLVRLIQATEAGEIYVPHRHDRHLDHEAAFELARAAAREAGGGADVLQYSIWMPWRSLLGWKMRGRDLAGAQRLRIDSVRERKRRAMAAYQSQIDVLPRGFLCRFHRPYELFFKLGLGELDSPGVTPRSPLHFAGESHGHD